MYYIKDNSFYEIDVKNSKFICHLFMINDKDEFDNILNDIKNKYKDASHYCYGYVVNGYQKTSDDGEPGGTAGMPILNVLLSNKLTSTGAIVIRYFGGIKLGAGGLVRAYTKCVSEAIKNNTLIELIEGLNITISFDYDKSKDVDYILKDSSICYKEFKDKIKYIANVSENVLDSLDSINIKYTVNGKIYIEKSKK